MKGFFDFIFSLIVCILFTPLFIIICILIKLDSNGPSFFKQTRVGKDLKEFEILKFRTMVTHAERSGQLTVGEKDNRITKVGFYLRKFKFDELPQFFNILKGEMSIVGPRPEVPKYVELYNNEQRKVLSVKPGITDLASIKYINENSLLKNADDPEDFYIKTIMPDKLKINLEYIERNNFLYDIKIIISTFLKIIN